MNEYDEKKDTQVCPECSSKLERVFKPMSGSVKLCSGMYGANGWNK